MKTAAELIAHSLGKSGKPLTGGADDALLGDQMDTTTQERRTPQRFQALKFDVKQVGPDADRTLEFTGSTGRFDRQRSIIVQDGWHVKDYRANPVFMWAHKWRDTPIGKALKVWLADTDEGKALKFLIQFVPESVDPFAERVFQLYKLGFLSATSVGFDPLKWKWVHEAAEIEKLGLDPNEVKWVELLQENDLLELSAVPIPANPDALISHLSGMDDAKSFVRTMGYDTMEDLAPEFLMEGIRMQAKRQQRDEHNAKVQSVMFSKSESPVDINDGNGWTAELATTWLGNNNLKSDNMADQDSRFRFLQFDSELCESGEATITDDLPIGISLFMCDASEATETEGADEDDPPKPEDDDHKKQNVAGAIDALNSLAEIQEQHNDAMMAGINEALEMLETEDDTTKTHDPKCGQGKKGVNLASMLNKRIDEMVTEEKTRADIIGDLASAAGIEEGTVNQILNASIECPPIERLNAFAGVLGFTEKKVVDSAKSDGCVYGDDDGDKGTKPKKENNDGHGNDGEGKSDERGCGGGTKDPAEPTPSETKTDPEPEDVPVPKLSDKGRKALARITNQTGKG